MQVAHQYRTARRRISLAGGTRAGSWARSKARGLQRTFVRRHWKELAGVVLATNFVGDLSVFFIDSAFGRGLVVGGLACSSVALVCQWIVQVTGTGPTMMGDEAEQWTASELRKLRRRHGWRLVNHFSLRPWDMDHVLVGPGGVFSLETKWSASSWTATDAESRIRAGANRSVGNARDLKNWHPIHSCGVTKVEPLLVLWGTDAPEAAERWGAEELGCTVVAGLDLATWRRSLAADALDRDVIEACWLALDEHCRKRENLGGDQVAVPIGFGGMILLAISSVLAAGVGLFAGCLWLSELKSLGWWSLLGLCLLAPGLLLDQTRARSLAWGWTFGAAACIPLLVGTVVAAAYA